MQPGMRRPLPNRMAPRSELMRERVTAILLVCAGGLAATARADGPTPTYFRDVLPVFQRRCIACHRPGGVGPFPLDDPEEALGWAAMIGEVVEERRMPPWQANPAVGHFSNSRALGDEERRTILEWVAAGAPAGDPAQAPPPVTFPEGWRIGEPDAVIEVPEYRVPATGTVDYVYFDVPTDFGEDRWVRAIEVQPGAASVVHHVLVFVIYPDGTHPRVRGGLKGYFASALPGDLVEPFPPGSARRLPRGTVLRFQMHYTPDGEERVDRTRMALRFARPDEGELREAETVSLYNTNLHIPPRARGHAVRARYAFQQDRVLYGLTPHMHVRGESFRYLLVLPDGTHRPLLDIPRWDFNWQNTYRLAEPLYVPAGSVMLGVATYDNSEDNPANPDPRRTVTFGEQTWDEMMIGYMDVVPPTPEETAAYRAAQEAR